MEHLHLDTEPNDRCLFAQILRQCSMDNNDSEHGLVPEEFLIQSPPLPGPHQHEQANLVVEQFYRWKGLEEEQEGRTSEEEPRLVRAQSLRLEQERKVNNFITVFGLHNVDPATGKLKAYSPQKQKKISKTRKY